MNKTATILTILLGLIGLVAFITGKQALPDFFSGSTSEIALKEKPKILKSPISLQDWLSTVSNEEQTDLQKSEFIKKHKGKIVVWEGYVHSVKEANVEQMKYSLALDSRKNSKNKILNYTLVFLPETENTNLINLNKGDFVRVKGLLFTNHLSVPVLTKAEILSVIKNSGQNE